MSFNDELVSLGPVPGTCHTVLPRLPPRAAHSPLLAPRHTSAYSGPFLDALETPKMEGGSGGSLVPSAPPFPKPQVERLELGGTADLTPSSPHFWFLPPGGRAEDSGGCALGLLGAPALHLNRRRGKWQRAPTSVGP